jgi:hypothetical protein
VMAIVVAVIVVEVVVSVAFVGSNHR